MKKLGFGLMRLPLINHEDTTSINYEMLFPMVDCFMDRGFTYFDTAYPYHSGFSQVALRKAVAERYPREAFVAANKMPTFFVTKPEDYPRIFDEQLEKCGVTYFDYYLLHNLGVTNYASTVKHGGFAFMQKLKEEGKAKRIGFSFHDTADLLDEILTDHPEMEFVQLQINYVDWESDSIQSRKCYEVARKHNKPVIVMEPVKGGTLSQVPPEVAALFKAHQPDLSVPSWAVRYAASLSGVEMVLSGMSDLSQALDNTAYMQDFVPLSAEEQRIVLQASELIKAGTVIPCTSCQYCVDDCPKKIPIPRYFAMYNQLKQFHNMMLEKLYYTNLSEAGHGKASACISCRQCEKHCPQHIDITGHLKEIALTFE